MSIESKEYRFSISSAESDAFARLSGDFNPLHVDPIKARRTQFGGTVTHGIHILLKSLDTIVGDLPLKHFGIATLSVTFSNPLRTGAQITIRTTFDAQTQKLRIQGEANQSNAFSATLTLTPLETLTADNPEDQDFTVALPNEESFPPQRNEGILPIRVHKQSCSALLPHLGSRVGLSSIGDLLASTRLVGMECPGLDSIYSNIKLQKREPQAHPSQTLAFKVSKLDERFRMVRLALTGVVLEGTIEAFFRPPPVLQMSLADIAHSNANLYSEQRALVIGGSRGLGELTAKLLLAGNAKVTITYATGREDATRIAQEASALSKACSLQHFDARVPLSADQIASLRAANFTHVYYFASPRIEKNVTAQWNQSLFDHYSVVYLQAFANLISTLALASTERKSLRCFYPSSVFVGEPEKGFAEYAAAKSAGEELCRYLGAQYGIEIATPRLPRMRTDQTSGLTGDAAPDAYPIMQNEIRSFCARAPK